VAGPSVFVAGATASYRTLTGMADNGIHQGYRWYDKNGVTPLFPFGFGLSYTSFGYSGLRTARSHDGGFDVSFTVRNIGSRAGSEVPQVYLGPSADLPASIQQAVRKLVGFDRVTLAPGRSAQVSLHVDRQQVSSWSAVGGRWLPGTGSRTVTVGSSSRDPRLTTTVTIR
jgi:beta-glucosidase